MVARGLINEESFLFFHSHVTNTVLQFYLPLKKLRDPDALSFSIYSIYNIMREIVFFYKF